MVALPEPRVDDDALLRGLTEALAKDPNARVVISIIHLLSVTDGATEDDVFLRENVEFGESKNCYPVGDIVLVADQLLRLATERIVRAGALDDTWRQRLKQLHAARAALDYEKETRQ
jgi:hypothetical protein